MKRNIKILFLITTIILFLIVGTAVATVQVVVSNTIQSNDTLEHVCTYPTCLNTWFNISQFNNTVNGVGSYNLSVQLGETGTDIVSYQILYPNLSVILSGTFSASAYAWYNKTVIGNMPIGLYSVQVKSCCATNINSKNFRLMYDYQYPSNQSSYYPLNDNVTDILSGYPGIISGTVGYAPGIINNGTNILYNFSGVNRVELGNHLWDNFSSVRINISAKNGIITNSNDSFYSLNDSNLIDSLAGYNGSSSGTVSYVPALSGNGLSTRYNAYGANKIELPAGKWDNLTEVNISFSVKLYGNNNTNYRCFFNHYVDDNNRLFICASDTDKLRVYIAVNGGAYQWDSTYSMGTSWHNISVKMSTKWGLTIFDNGLLVHANSSYLKSFSNMGVSTYNSISTFHSSGASTLFSNDGIIDSLSVTDARYKEVFNHYVDDNNFLFIGTTDYNKLQLYIYRNSVAKQYIWSDNIGYNWHNISIGLDNLNGLDVVDNNVSLYTDSTYKYSFNDFGSSSHNILGAIWYGGVPFYSFNGTLDELSVVGSVPTNDTETTYTYNSTYDSTTRLTANIKYNNAINNSPILVVIHQFGGTANDIDDEANDLAFNLSYNPYFVIVPNARFDVSGMEIYDIIDAVEALKNNATFAQYLDKNNTFVYGVSGGGGNIYTMLARFPQYFKAASPYFGITDYATWNTESDGKTPDYGTTMDSILGTVTQNASKYAARSLNGTSHNAYNNFRTPVLAYHSPSDSYVYSHHTSDIDNATNYPNQTFNIWSNITHGMNENLFTRSSINSFYQSHINDSVIDYQNINMTILGNLNYSGIQIQLYNFTTGQYVDNIGYITQIHPIVSGHYYQLRRGNNNSIISTKIADSNAKVNFNLTTYTAMKLYDLNDTTIPISITNNQTIAGNFYINNTWTDPTDSDLDYVYFTWVNGTWIENVSVGTEYLNLTHILHFVQNISAQTVDTSGNMNMTKVWFNATIPNNIPVLNYIGSKSIEEDTELNFTVSGTDLDNDTLTYSQNGSGALNSSTGVFSWTPATSGTYYVNFTVNDSYGGLDYEVVEITVTNNYNLTSCQDITNEGTYYLQNNITENVPTCFDIQVNNVSINGNGYYITRTIMGGTYGIRANNTTNTKIYNITVNNWDYGMRYTYTNNSQINNSIITNSSTFGILLLEAYNNIIHSNIIENNDRGIKLLNSNNNNLIYNNYLNNTINAQDDLTTNSWNTTKTLQTNIINESYIGGNFWGNATSTGYSETCFNGDLDMICDTPYTNGNIIDYLPLTHLYTPPITEFIPNTVSSCSDSHADTTINISCTPNNNNNITNSLNITRLNDNTWNNGSMFWAQSGLLESTQYNYRVYSYNSSGNGSLNLTYFEENITTDTTPLTNYRLSGLVVPSGSTIAVTGQGSLTGGSYDFGQVFLAGYTYWVNVSHTGYTSNNSQITFGASDIVYDVTLNAIIVNATPIITSWKNNNTNNKSLNISVEIYKTVEFNFTANQTLTSCNWNGATQINCSVLDSYAQKNFTLAGIQTVQAYGISTNGTTQTITWTINVNNTYPTPTPDTLNADFYISKENQVIGINLTENKIAFRIILNGLVTSTIVEKNDIIIYSSNNILYTSNKLTGEIISKYYLNDKINILNSLNNSLITII
jgi:hypothetical protein